MHTLITVPAECTGMEGFVDRAVALAFPWWTTPMKVGTAVLAVGLVVIQIPGMPVGPLSAVGNSPQSIDALPAVAGAAAVTSALKAVGIAVRVPLSLHYYSD